MRNGVLLMASVLVLLVALPAWANSAPDVANITVSQRTDGSKLVDIYYNLADADGDACTVTVLASDDNGATWTVPITAVTGHVGGGVTPGMGKHIIWNSAADLPGAFGSQYKVRVCADDGHTSVPPDMVPIAAGEFQMGDTFNEGRSEELPVHTVFISPYHIDKYEVTKGLWDTVRTWATSNGYDLIAGSGKAADHPVHNVNWYDCVKWCNARSQQEGRTPCYYTNAGLTTVYRTGEVAPYVKWDANGYRLPTEAEWEKAARGGTPGHRFPWSDTDTIQHARANYYSASEYSYDTSPTGGFHPNFDEGGYPYTSPVGYFAANGYDLHDMAGNVWEWCNDWHSNTYYQDYLDAGSPPDPRGPGPGYGRVLRGGFWYHDPDACRSAFRFGYWPDYRVSYIGFRCALGTP